MAVHVWCWLAALPRPWTRDTLGYVGRSVVAAVLALWLGLQLHLDSPFSAASTVLLLIHPIQGAVVGKGVMRVVGTLLGLAVAVILMGMFAQQMLLFILGIGVWLGLCVAAMTLLRHYHATAAVVAGYTVCLALGPAIVAPEQGFDHIVTRGTAVVLGVLSLSLVASLLGRKTVESQLKQALGDVSTRTLRLLALRFKGDAGDPAQLALDINKVDELLGIGRGESYLIRSRLKTLQGGLAHLQAAVLVTPSLPPLPACVGAGQALEQLAQIPFDFVTAAARVSALQGVLENESESPDGLTEAVADLSGALSSFASLESATPPPVRTVAFHRHYGDALRNGVRALAATLVTGAVWYLTGWDQGPTLLAVLGPCCTLLATHPAPTRGLDGFLRGTLYGIVAAAACKFLLLPQINGFALLSVVLSVFWVWGIQATTQPRHALQGIAYLIAFNTLVGTGGTAHYDFIDFANQALAWLVAMAICMLAFQILPRKPGSHVRALQHALHRDILRLLRAGGRMNLSKWHARQLHRLVSLRALSGTDDPPLDAVGYLSLELGRSLGRLHNAARLLVPGTSIAQCADRGAYRLARYAGHPAINALQARRTANALRRLGEPGLAERYQVVARLLAHYANLAGVADKPDIIDETCAPTHPGAPRSAATARCCVPGFPHRPRCFAQCSAPTADARQSPGSPWSARGLWSRYGH